MWRTGDIVPDAQVDLGSLPGLLGREIGRFPTHAGYLCADTASVAAWRTRLASLDAAKIIGISWRGGTRQSREHARSLPLHALRPLFELEGTRLVSLQYGDCGDEIERARRQYGLDLLHWQDAIDDYDQTTALVTALHSVVSVQTAVAHLAGALGKRVHVMVPSVAEWRYLESGSGMPWYPSMSLHRQQDAGEWNNVIAQIAVELKRD
jgi:hypothetical protein